MTGNQEAAKVTLNHHYHRHHHKVKQQRSNKQTPPCHSVGSVVAPVQRNGIDDITSSNIRMKPTKQQVCHYCRQTGDLCCSELRCC
uniref:Uncharacterized protein n=1 Tax=Glossina brevipalpis TaxID=37001 RepID=A0A1A9WHF6_9MUSC